jgi:hypothetical protein
MSQTVGSVQANLARLSTESASSYDTLLLEAVELKLYYLRDTHTPQEFDDLVDLELIRTLTPSDPETTVKDFVRSIKKRICKIFG